MTAEKVSRSAKRGLTPEAIFARRGIHYGWVMVAVTFICVVTSSGVRTAPGVLIHPLEHEFGWSRASISLAIAASLLTYGLAAPFSAYIGNRYGLRTMALSFLLVAGLGVAWTSTIDQLWQLQLFWGLLVGLGTGGVTMVMAATVANTWFEKKRGLVTGILGGSASAGQLVFLPLLVFVTSQWGWRTSIGLMAVLLVGFVLPVVFFFMRSKPRDIGLDPFGATGASLARAAADTRITPITEAAKTRDFWILASTFFVCGFTSVGLIGAHFIPHATEHGFSEGEAAGILSVMGAMNAVGALTSGWLCDRYQPQRLLAGYYFFRALSLLALPLISTTGLPLMSLFAITFGLDFIATVPPTVMLAAERFGRRSVGSIYGWISFVHMVGGALASYFAGYIHDVAGEYTIAIYFAGLLGLLAATLTFGISIQVRRTPAVAPSAA
ncbi:MAG: MFS transporter [Dehalococcoidia bacterium]